MFSFPMIELSRFRRSMLTKLAIVVILLIPTVYGGIYLAANWNPTGHLDRLSAAIVNEDEGANAPSQGGGKGERVDAGKELTDNITDSDSAGFTWHSESASDAQKGLDSGKYAAVLTVPRDFSQHLVSSGGDDPEQAQLQIQSNDANNYIVGKATQQILSGIRENLNKTTTAKYVNQIYIAFNDIHGSMNKAADSAGELHKGAAKLHKGAGELDKGAAQLTEGTGQSVKGTRDLHTGLVKLDEGSGKLADASGQAEAGAKKLSQGASQVADGTGQLHEKADQATRTVVDFKGRADELVDATTPRIDRAAKDFEDTRNQVRGGISDDIAQLQKQYPDDPAVQRLAQRASAVGDDLDSANQRAVTAFEDGKELRKKAQRSADDAVGQVKQADQQIGKLDSGAKQVAKGTGDLHTGLGQLNEGAVALHKGTDAAADGSQKLADGAVKLDEGANKLAEGAHGLNDGSKQLDDGSGKLAQGLSDGVKKIPTYSKSDRDDRSNVVALPVTGKDKPKNAVEYYGEGLAPMFIALALWIGGMITYMILKAIPFRALASSAGSWHIAWSGYVPGIILGAGQVLLLWAVLAFMLDFTVSTWLWTLAFSALVAASFHAVHQMFVVVFGAIGRLLALVLLIIQLGAAGGTYPVATTPAFFQVVSPFLPMTWAVSGLRALIAGGEPIQAVRAALMLLIILIVCLLISTASCAAKRMVTLKDLHPSLQI